MIQLPEILILIYKSITGGRLSHRLSSCKDSFTITCSRKNKEVKESKIDEKQRDGNDKKIESKQIRKEPSFSEDEVDEDGKLIPEFITEIKREFNRIDDQLEMIEFKFDFIFKELKVRQETFSFSPNDATEMQ